MSSLQMESYKTGPEQVMSRNKFSARKIRIPWMRIIWKDPLLVTLAVDMEHVIHEHDYIPPPDRADTYNPV